MNFQNKLLLRSLYFVSIVQTSPFAIDDSYPDSSDTHAKNATQMAIEIPDLLSANQLLESVRFLPALLIIFRYLSSYKVEKGYIPRGIFYYNLYWEYG